MVFTSLNPIEHTSNVVICYRFVNRSHKIIFECQALQLQVFTEWPISTCDKMWKTIFRSCETIGRAPRITAKEHQPTTHEHNFFGTLTTPLTENLCEFDNVVG